MKQLLVWCGSRALPEKPLGEVENANERMTGMFHYNVVSCVQTSGCQVL